MNLIVYNISEKNLNSSCIKTSVKFLITLKFKIDRSKVVFKLHSQIIHVQKTKGIAIMKEVWKCDLHYHKMLGTFVLSFSKIINSLRSYIKTLQREFHPVPKSLK